MADDVPLPLCQVCRHPERERIEALRAIGTSFDDLAEKFGIERTSIFRHWHKHVSPERRNAFLCGPAQVEELRVLAAKENGTVLEYLATLRAILMGQVVQRAEAGDTFKVSNAAARLLDVLKQIGVMTGEIEERAKGASFTTINNVAVMTNPIFLEVQGIILDALRPFPEAKAAVIAALRQSDVARPPMIEARPDAA